MSEGTPQDRTIAEYAKEYSLSRYTINKAIERQSLASRKSGGTHLVRQTDFDAWYIKYCQNPRIQKKQNRFPKSQEIDQKTP